MDSKMNDDSEAAKSPAEINPVAANPMPLVKQKIATELSRLGEDCVHSSKKQFNAADRWNRWNYVLGMPSIVLSALTGAAFMKDLPLAAGLLASALTGLTALMTFLKPSERASAHKASGDQYLTLCQDARRFREINLPYLCDDLAAQSFLTEYAKRVSDLNAASRQCSRADFERARAGIKEGQASHEVDKASLGS
jgi:hypothetical protein